ncbi:MAG: rod shape-determining protein MreC [Magnetococcales bacterium]|nr:rod shape-determining protein MreC [Magnetococcales bacterium]
MPSGVHPGFTQGDHHHGMLSALLHLLQQNRRQITAGFLMLCALTLMLASRAAPPNLSTLYVVTLDLFGPVQRVLGSPLEFYRSARARYDEIRRVDQDNRALKASLASQSSDRVRMMELLKENRRLRTLLGIPTDPSYRMLAARIVGNSSSSFSRAFTLHIGSRHGVISDAAVVAADGLIGRVAHVGNNSTLALSIHDLNSRIPVMTQRTRIRGIASGTNTPVLHMAFVPKEADIMYGDRVITSGAGGVFPKGIMVGRVIEAQSHDAGLFQKVVIRPEADADRVEEARLLIRQPLKAPVKRPTAPAERQTPPAPLAASDASASQAAGE